MNIIEASKPKIGKDILSAAKTYFDSDNHNLNILYRLMKKQGWKKIGAGAFAIVFSNPEKPYVVKITTIPDLGYDHYVQSIKKFRNKHFPKISDRKEISYDFNDPLTNDKETIKFFIYFIEKLYAIDGRIKYSLASELYDIAFESYANQKEIKNIHNNYIKNDPSLFKAAQIVGKMAQNKYFEIDIHAGNIMRREDGTIVITDPYA
jgi:hypothetical protein